MDLKVVTAYYLLILNILYAFLGLFRFYDGATKNQYFSAKSPMSPEIINESRR